MSLLTTTAQPAETAPVITTQCGAVRGVDLGGVLRYYGVPYAAPPIGALRFAKPQQPAAWGGVRDALKKGAIAPQPITTAAEMEKVLPGLDIEPLTGAGQEQGDDCLLANIWAPANASRAPVMVFIHGGAFTGGAGSADVCDGTAFARQGIVLVTINYRLGIEGFLPIPGAPTNLGLRDQIAALQWVQDNIAAFGGDASNVTVFGASAGAMSVANLITSPLAKGLFKRAIIQSGHGNMVRPTSVAQRLVHKLAKMLRVAPDVDGFRSAPIAASLAAQRKLSHMRWSVDLRNADGREPAFGLTKFLPVYGDDVLPQHPMTALANGLGAEIDLLIGTNSEEMNLYLVPTGATRKMMKTRAHLAMKKLEPHGSDILKSYGIDEKDVRAGEAFTRALSDLAFRLPARRFAQAHRGRTHFYEFSWRSPVYDNALGACHALELPFVFDTLHTLSGPRGIAGPNPTQELATRMNKLWSDFAKTGELTWPAYEKSARHVYTPSTGKFALEPEMPAEGFDRA